MSTLETVCSQLSAHKEWVGDGGEKGAKTKQALMSWEKGEREQWKRCLARSHQHQVTQSNLEAEE